MKNKGLYILLAILVVLVIVLLGIKSKAPEASENETQSSQKSIITLSASAGFYDEPFSLTIEAGDYPVYYTLDGSTPSTENTVYEDPLYISDASTNENIYSARDDVSIFFKTGDYHVPTNTIDKCTVLRAAIFDDQGQMIDQITASYFVGFQDKTGYEGLNYVSIVTDPDNLFDYNTGIYVLGSDFDQAVSEGQDYSTPETRYRFPANYENKGKKWEREVNGQFFSSDGTLLMSQSFGIRIKGQGMRDGLPKGLNLYAREEYGTGKYFETDLLGNGYNVKKMSLNACGIDRSKSKSVMVARLVEEAGLDISVMKYSPYVLFLDGEYWGVYWLTDKFDKLYVQEHYGVDKDNVVIIKQNEVEEGDDEDIELYNDLINFFTEHDMSIDANYEEAKKLVDMESLIDYYATEIYIANCDWPFNNYELWRSRKGSGDGYGDGRWRWMLYDLDALGCMDQWMAESVTLDSVRENDIIFDSLSNNTEFRQEFSDKLRELGDGIFSSDQINPVIDSYVSLMYLPVEKEAVRFARDEYDAAITQGEYMKTFFERRRSFIEDQIEEYLAQ